MIKISLSLLFLSKWYDKILHWKKHYRRCVCLILIGIKFIYLYVFTYKYLFILIWLHSDLQDFLHVCFDM